jgi:hypothetical protein
MKIAKEDKIINEFIKNIDVLIDGKFEINKIIKENEREKHK